MKTILKRIITAIMCAVIAIAGIGVNTVYAAEKKVPLKIAFNGASVNLVKDLISGDDETPKIKSLEKKWGEASKKKLNSDYPEYVWKKGKTSIKVTMTDSTEKKYKGRVRSIHVDIKDKNGSMFGIKVGMEKETALKKLQKATGISTVNYSEETDPGKIGITITSVENGEKILFLTGVYMPISFELKDGRVSYISFWKS